MIPVANHRGVHRHPPVAGASSSHNTWFGGCGISNSRYTVWAVHPLILSSHLVDFSSPATNIILAFCPLAGFAQFRHQHNDVFPYKSSPHPV